MIQILLRGAYPKSLRRCAASGIFIPSLMNASIQRLKIKMPLRLRRKGFVNRIGQISNHFIEDLKSLDDLAA
jgi:hypothetical protein